MGSRGGTKNGIIFVYGKQPYKRNRTVIMSDKEGKELIEKAVYDWKTEKKMKASERLEAFEEKARKEGVDLEDVSPPEGYDLWDRQGAVEEKKKLEEQSEVEVPDLELDETNEGYEIKNWKWGISETSEIFYKLLGESEVKLSHSRRKAFRWCLENWE